MNKKVNSNDTMFVYKNNCEPKIIYLSSKVKIIIGIIMDIDFTFLIPVWILILMKQFNPFLLILVFYIYLVVIFVSIFIYRKKVIITNEYIKFIELKKVSIPIKDIISISSNQRIEVKTLKRTYRFSGYIFLKSIDKEKNDELVQKINELIK